MPNITVYTSVTGGKDTLVEGQNKGGALFLAYVDTLQSSKDWGILPAYDKFTSARKNSRAPKILAHKYIATQYSIYIDGNMRLLLSPEIIVERYLQDCDMAVFKHPSRDCLYDEAMVCATAKLDDPEAIIEQAKAYEVAGFGKHKGLYECGFIVRRHTEAVERFNNAWWAEYSRYSVRDQIAFPFSKDRARLRVNVIDEPWVITETGTVRRGDIVEMVNHLTDRREP